jgi:hypothetical protein
MVHAGSADALVSVANKKFEMHVSPKIVRGGTTMGSVQIASLELA